MKRVTRPTFQLVLVLMMSCPFSFVLQAFQITYGSPYTNIDVATAYNMIAGSGFPDLIVLDVRTKSEYDIGHLYKAAWIPVEELESRISELTPYRDNDIIAYCRTGVRSAQASSILDSNNFTAVYNMLGGILAWESAGYPVWMATVHNVNTTFNYDTIQAAIAAPQTLNDHTILVDEGIYYENVVVDKSVSIVAGNETNTIVDGNGTGTVFHVIQDGVNITGFFIRESGGYPEACIALVNVRNCSVSANVIDNYNKTTTAFIGISLDSSEGNTIAGNDVVNNVIGMNIYLSSNNTINENRIAHAHVGIQIANSSNSNMVLDNNLTNCDYGISLDHASGHNNVSRNQIELGSIVGLAIETGSSNNSVIENTIVNNVRGIHILWSANNRFHHNCIRNNTLQTYVVAGYTNEWDDGYPSGGNFWSDYSGTDLDYDGIGDSPYRINAYNTDNYPLMLPYGTIPGDVNRDGYVGSEDIYLIASHFSSGLGDPGYSRIYDLSGDGYVGIDDIFHAALHFGEEA